VSWVYKLVTTSWAVAGLPSGTGTLAVGDSLLTIDSLALALSRQPDDTTTVHIVVCHRFVPCGFSDITNKISGIPRALCVRSRILY